MCLNLSWSPPYGWKADLENYFMENGTVFWSQDLSEHTAAIKTLDQLLISRFKKENQITQIEQFCLAQL